MSETSRAAAGATPSTSLRPRALLGLVAAALALAISGCSTGGSSTGSDASADPSADSSADASGSASEGADGPDVSDVPDVVAEVNGEELTKEEFVPIYTAQLQQATSQSQMTGEAPDDDAVRQQALDNLVDTELLLQEADARGIEVTDDDVEAELGDLAEQNQLDSVDDLLAAVEEQGVTPEVARSQVRTQITVDQLVADEDGGAYEPTDKELRALYDQAKQQQEQAGQAAQSLPPFAEVRDQVAEQARSQHVGEVAQTLVDGLREDADITSNL